MQIKVRCVSSNVVGGVDASGKVTQAAIQQCTFQPVPGDPMNASLVDVLKPTGTIGGNSMNLTISNPANVGTFKLGDVYTITIE